MANTILQLKKSGVTGNVPDSLAYGELALNYADGKLYYKAANASIASISTGSMTNSFATVNSNNSLILATSPTDTLSIIPGNNITISTDTVGKRITINSVSDGSAADQFARDTANLAYNQANSATTLAQDAYDYANTISSGTVDTFVLNHFPTGDYGSVEDSIFGGLGDEIVGATYDMRIEPFSINGLIQLDAGTI